MQEILEHCEDLPRRDVAAGEVLIEQGQRPGVLYVLERGTLVIERDGSPFTSVDSPGSVLGELSAILGHPTTATVRAVTACRVRVASDPHAFLTERPGVALGVLRIVAGRLESLTAYLGDIKRQFAEHDNHFAMIDQVLDVLIHHQPSDVKTGSRRDPDTEY